MLSRSLVIQVHKVIYYLICRPSGLLMNFKVTVFFWGLQKGIVLMKSCEYYTRHTLYIQLPYKQNLFLYQHVWHLNCHTCTGSYMYYQITQQWDCIWTLIQSSTHPNIMHYYAWNDGKIPKNHYSCFYIKIWFENYH